MKTALETAKDICEKMGPCELRTLAESVVKLTGEIERINKIHCDQILNVNNTLFKQSQALKESGLLIWEDIAGPEPESDAARLIYNSVRKDWLSKHGTAKHDWKAE